MNWKILAIVFMVLFLLQSLLFGWILYLGMSMLYAETECASICEEMGGDSYLYSDDSKYCRCYLEAELFFEERIR